MSKRPRGRAAPRTSSRRPPSRTRSAPPADPEQTSLHFKVVELSSVDEASLERTLNEWVGKGWTLDGIQFAMRDSSKRPAMAFVLFTRQGKADEQAPQDDQGARRRLQSLADSSLTSVHAFPEQDE
jgi:hypothetical protein